MCSDDSLYMQKKPTRNMRVFHFIETAVLQEMIFLQKNKTALITAFILSSDNPCSFSIKLE